MALAGLWETWAGPNGEEVDTACIVTTAANRTMAAVHDRMPVIIAPDAFDLWLNCGEVDALTAEALIQPAPDNLLEVWPVSTAVNRTANDNAELILPLDLSAVQETPQKPKPAARPRTKSEASDGGQGMLF